MSGWARESSFVAWVGFISAAISLIVFFGDLFSDGKLLSTVSSIEFQIPESGLKDENTETTSRPQNDRVLTSMLKGVWVGISLCISVVLSIFAFIIDLIALPFGGDSNALRGLWSYTWNNVTIHWFWEQATTGGSLLGIIAAIFTAVVLSGMIFEG